MTPPLPCVLPLPPPLERIGVAGGLLRLHQAGSLLPLPSAILPPPLERIEAAGGVLKPRAASWTPPLPSVLYGGGGWLTEAARSGLGAAAVERAAAVNSSVSRQRAVC